MPKDFYGWERNRYNQNDTWLNDQVQGYLDDFEIKIGKLRFEIEDEIENIRREVEYYQMDGATGLEYIEALAGRGRRHKKSKKRSAEKEKPKQQSIEKRWEKVWTHFEPHIEEEEVESSKVPLRKRLGITAVGSTAFGSYGALAGAAAAVPITSMAGAFFVGAGTLFGGGYGLYISRNRDKHAPQFEPQEIETEKQLSNDQIDQLQSVSYGIASHVLNGDWNHDKSYTNFEISETELSDAVAAVPGETNSDKVDDLLSWIDTEGLAKGMRKYARNTNPYSGTDTEMAVHKLNAVRLNWLDTMGGVNDAVGLQPYHWTPLLVASLVRMDRRGSFMTAHADEFARLQELIDDQKAKRDEYRIIFSTARKLGDDGEVHLGVLLKGMEHEINELKKEIILTDLKIAALAYIFDTGADAQRVSAEVNNPIEQMGMWEKSVNELCAISLDGVSEPMREVIVSTLNACVTIEQSGAYGAAAQKAVAYLDEVVRVITDEEEADEARQKIATILSDK